MGNLYDHAKRELKQAGLLDQNADYGPEFGLCILKTVETFSTRYGHSGGSAELGTQLLERLLRFQSLQDVPVEGTSLLGTVRTKEMLDELLARFDVDGDESAVRLVRDLSQLLDHEQLEYRTVDDDV